jgi:glycyl-tRNA synthetase beta chain
MNTQSLLIELGTEELPPKALAGLAHAFAEGVSAGLTKRGIAFAQESMQALYSPRRLAVRFDAVNAEQATQHSEVFGPYANIALDANGEATPALVAFAKKSNLDVGQLQKTTDAKGERFVARSEKPGADTASLIPEIVREALAKLPIPKPMRWGSRDIHFVRPVHWLVILLGNNVVEGEVLGLKAGRQSRGHRFHAPNGFDIASPETYVDALRANYVLVNANERKTKIAQQLHAAAASVSMQAVLPEDLLDEVNCLVEWPSAVLCQFDADFLRVPHEALISTMQSNQKFFPLQTPQDALSEYFVGIANIESSDVAQIKKGYERVIRPRFADAQFFYDEDIKQGIDSMAQGLASVTYQQKLGSYADKTARIATLAESIAEQVGLNKTEARRAAELSKADLQSRMVGEFPELQGIAGRYYAKAAGESEAIAVAIDEAYQPRFAGDAIAPSKLGQVLAIAERLDTLAGGFAAGLKPTGNKDPFALRRNALGLARTLLEGGFDISLPALIGVACDTVGPISLGKNAAVAFADRNEILGFIYDRLRGYFNEQGFSEQQFDAVNAVEHQSLPDFSKRINAIAEFAKLPEASVLAAANKRIGNILKKSAIDAAEKVSENLLQEQAEKDLWQAVSLLERSNAPKLQARDYVGVLQALAGLRAPVDAFFESVMVNADDSGVRANRLALLRTIATQFNAVGDISLLAN